MWNAVWMVFAVGTLIGVFAVSVGVVVAGIRVLEGYVAKRSRKSLT